MKRQLTGVSMDLRLWSLALVAILSGTQAASGQTTMPASLVNPFIGTAPNPVVKVGWSFDTGNVFPGAVCPRGIVAWSPDTTHRDKIAGGYWYPDDKIEDFSLTHFSGRGVPCLMNVGFVPLAETVTLSPGSNWKQYASSYSHQNESASPGFYHVKLDSGVDVELSVTPRTGMGRFTFPPGSPATLCIRANGSIAVKGDTVSGHADTTIGKGHEYKTFFFARLSSTPTGVKTWVADKITDADSAEGPSSGAVLSFDPASDPTVQVRVGVSYTSLENAEDNLKQEDNDLAFETVKQNVEKLWNDRLSCVQIEGGTPDEQTVFYTALYHCFIHPNWLDDANGQYIGMDGQVHRVTAGHHQYQNIPAWDEHRSHSPLMAILANQESADVMQSLVNYAQQDASVRTNGGGMPRWEQVNQNTGGMIGDGDDSIIASSFAYGVTGFDAKAALQSMDKGASQFGTTSDTAMVRGGLKNFVSKGYVPEDGAATLEYCNDDFALSQFARSLGDEQEAQVYLKRAQNWKNLFDPTTGYIRPRTLDGSWVTAFSPAVNKGFTEGTAAQYLWLVNFNLRALIDLMGGNDKAVQRLDHFFTQVNGGLHSEFAWMGNEPCEETPWVYDFASAPWRTQAVVRKIQDDLFTTQPNGFPGNDDAGAISSWYVFSALGIYPEIPGVAGFVVGSPRFPKVTVHLDNGKTITIAGLNASKENPFVKSVQLNGQPHQSPWIPWSALSNGGTIVFDLTSAATKWGSDPNDAPPSFDIATGH